MSGRDRDERATCRLVSRGTDGPSSVSPAPMGHVGLVHNLTRSSPAQRTPLYAHLGALSCKGIPPTWPRWPGVRGFDMGRIS